MTQFSRNKLYQANADFPVIQVAQKIASFVATAGMA
jgi:hypothetical protein